ncbi:hypothetical protein LTR51_008633 [Lithohypha guttulata]|nr:hypothetical protein LTR51_008633 [Lithohypha guttulata]
MLAGNIRALMGIKCDEEIVHYLSHIYQTFSFLLDGDVLAMAKVDRHTIEQLQSRNPANCRQDRTLLEPMVEAGSIFRAFDLAARRAIWDKLLVHRGLVLSLQTFFEDLKYLKVLAHCVLKLVQPVRLQTVRQAFKEAYVGNSSPIRAYDCIPARTEPDGFDLAYRQVWVWAMRHLEDLRPGSVLLEGRDRIETRRKNFHAEYDFASEAHRLGFQSPKIDELLKADPDRIEARETLFRVRPPDRFTYSSEQLEDCIDQIVQLYGMAQPRDAPAGRPQLIVEGPGENDIGRRCGRPHRHAFEESAAFMSLNNLHMNDSTKLGGLSAFYVRRHVYLSFFGASEAHDMTDLDGVDPDQYRDRNSASGSVCGHADDEESWAVVQQSALARQQSPQRSEVPAYEIGSRDIELRRSDSASQYSDIDSQYTDITPPYNNDATPSREIVPWALVKFVYGARDNSHVLEDVAVHSSADLAVEFVASRYRREGCLLFDEQGRSMHPSECLVAALESDDRVIVVVPRHEQNSFVTSTASSKRKAGDDLPNQRPRKLFIVEAPPQARRVKRRNMIDDNIIPTFSFDDDFDDEVLHMCFDSTKQDIANLQEICRKCNNLLRKDMKPAVVPELLAAGG